MNGETTKWILTAVGLLLIFFGPEDLGLTVPVGIGLIGVAWLEE